MSRDGASRYIGKSDDGKLGRSEERIAEIERSAPYVVHDGFIVIMYEMTKAAELGTRRS